MLFKYLLDGFVNLLRDAIATIQLRQCRHSSPLQFTAEYVGNRISTVCCSFLLYPALLFFEIGPLSMLHVFCVRTAIFVGMSIFERV